MRIRQAKKILRSGFGDPTRWGGPHRPGTRRAASKRVEQYLGGYRGVIEMGRQMGL